MCSLDALYESEEEQELSPVVARRQRSATRHTLGSSYHAAVRPLDLLQGASTTMSSKRRSKGATGAISSCSDFASFDSPVKSRFSSRPLSCSPPPKRKSLHEQIDADHPLSRSVTPVHMPAELAEEVSPPRNVRCVRRAVSVPSTTGLIAEIREWRESLATKASSDGDSPTPAAADENSPAAANAPANLGWGWLKAVEDAAQAAPRRGPSSMWSSSEALLAEAAAARDNSKRTSGTSLFNSKAGTEAPPEAPLDARIGAAPTVPTIRKGRSRKGRRAFEAPPQPVPEHQWAEQWAPPAEAGWAGGAAGEGLDYWGAAQSVAASALATPGFGPAASPAMSPAMSPQMSPQMSPAMMGGFPPEFVLGVGQQQPQFAEYAPPQMQMQMGYYPQQMAMQPPQQMAMMAPGAYAMGYPPQPMMVQMVPQQMQPGQHMAQVQVAQPMMMPMQQMQPMPQPSAPPPPHQAYPQMQQPPPAAAPAPPPASTPATAAPEGRATVRWGQLHAMAMDPKGSRALQAELPHLSKAQLARLRKELAPHLLELATHTFGNYLVSKLAALPALHDALLGAFKGHAMDLICHPQGSRVMQAALGALPVADATTLAEELDGHVLECALDTHGSWGVCLAFERTHAPFILAQVTRNVYALSTQQHGCRVVQAVMQEAAAARMELSASVAAVLDGELEYLATHCYGNYAVQVALKESHGAQRERIMGALLPRTLVLATSKHGSNVAEQMLGLATPEQLGVAHALVFGGAGGAADAAAAAHDDDAPLAKLMSHPFGNYVLQSLLRRLEPEARAAALARVRTATSASNYGRSILSRCAVGGDEA